MKLTQTEHQICDDYEQLSLFACWKKEFKIKKPVRLIELFAGIGSQAMALKTLGVDFEHYRVVEFDKFAVKSYNAICGADFKPIDITKIKGDDLGIIDTQDFTYLLTYSFPCQDLSVAGKQKGMTKGNNTRSGLLWEIERLLNECEELPQVLLMENVSQVHSKSTKKKVDENGDIVYDDKGNIVYEKSNYENFMEWIEFLKSKGYSNYWQDLNARDYGVAQNRNRCFMVSILGDYNFKFPNPIPLKKVMKDYLEDTVDDKYYITSEKAKKLIDELILNGKILTEQNRTWNALTSQLTSQESSKKQTALKQDTMTESQTCKQMEPVLLSGMPSNSWKPGINKIDVACTLCARDYKGLNNYGSNGVIECEKIT